VLIFCAKDTVAMRASQGNAVLVSQGFRKLNVIVEEISGFFFGIL